MDSDLTLASELTIGFVSDDNAEQAPLSTPSEIEADASGDELIKKLTMKSEHQPSDSIAEAQASSDPTSLFLRQEPVSSEPELASFSFGKIAPHLLSIGKAVVKPALLFSQGQKALEAEEEKGQDTSTDTTSKLSSAIDEEAQSTKIPTATYVEISDDDDSDQSYNVGWPTQPVEEDKREVTSSPTEQREFAHNVQDSSSLPASPQQARLALKRTLLADDDTDQHRSPKRIHLQDAQQADEHMQSVTSRVNQSISSDTVQRSRTQRAPSPQRPIAKRQDSRWFPHPTSRTVHRSNAANSTTESTTRHSISRSRQPAHFTAVPAPNRQEMNEALQIVAHTWARAQMSAGKHAQTLAQELNAAKEEICDLSQDIEHLTAQNDRYFSETTAQAAREESWREKFTQFKDTVQDLQQEITTLRTNADVHEEALQGEKSKIKSLDELVSKLQSQLLRRAKRTHKLSTKMVEAMHEMKGQLESSQLAAEYLLIQLEEKTGLLVEARDEVNTLRSRQHEFDLWCHNISDKIDAGTNVVIEQFKMVKGSFDQDDRIGSSIQDAMASLMSTQPRQEAEFAALQESLNELVTKFTRWAADSARADVETQTIDTALLQDQFTNITTIIQNEFDALKHKASLQQEIHELERKLAKANTTTAELLSSLDQARVANESTRTDYDAAETELMILTGGLGDSCPEMIKIVTTELSNLKRDVEMADHRLAERTQDRDKLREQLDLVNKQLNTALQEERELQRRHHDLGLEMAEQAFEHADKLLQLAHDHQEAQRKQEKTAAYTLQQREEQLHLANAERETVEEELLKVTAERNDLHTGMLSMIDEQELTFYSTPLLEEQANALREQLHDAEAALAEAEAAATALESKHLEQMSKLTAEYIETQQRRSATDCEASDLVRARDSLAARNDTLEASITQMQSALIKTRNKLEQTTKDHQTFKNGVDKMWKKEEEKHNDELATLRQSHIALEAEMLQAENNAVQLHEKLMTAQQTIQDLQARLEQATAKEAQASIGLTAEHPMMRRSISRSQSRHTPDTAMNELFNILSNASQGDLLPAAFMQRTPLVPEMQSDGIASQTRTSALANTSTKIQRAPYGMPSDYGRSFEDVLLGSSIPIESSAVEQRHGPRLATSSPGREYGLKSTKLSHQPLGSTSSKAIDGRGSGTILGTQDASNHKVLIGRGTDRTNFGDMLSSLSSQPEAIPDLPSKRATTKTRGKLKSLAKTGRRPLTSVEGNKRSRAHLARSSKQKYDERFDQEF